MIVRFKWKEADEDVLEDWNAEDWYAKVLKPGDTVTVRGEKREISSTCWHFGPDHPGEIRLCWLKPLDKPPVVDLTLQLTDYNEAIRAQRKEHPNCKYCGKPHPEDPNLHHVCDEMRQSFHKGLLELNEALKKLKVFEPFG